MRLINNFTVIVLMMCILAFTASSLAQTPKKIPMRDFFKNPEKSGFTISPNGKYVAHVEPYERRMNIFVQSISGGKAKRITSVTDRDLSGYFWKGSDRLLFVKDFGGDENFHLFAVDREGKEMKDLTPFDSVRVDVVDDLKDHPTDVLIGMNKRNREIFDVYRLNTVTGELKMVAENPGNITGWVTDHDGNIRIATTTDGVNTSILYRDTEKDQFQNVMTTNFKESFGPLFFTFDNKNIYAVSNLGRDKTAIVEYDIANKKEVKVLYERDDVDVNGMDYSRLRKVLTEIGYVTWKIEHKFLDKETEDLYSKLEKKLPGYEVTVVSSDKNEEVFTVSTSSDRTRGSFYLYEKKSDKLTKLADRSPWLEEKDMAEMKPIEYKSRDGLTIYGYLTLPKGKDAKNLPVIVNPHGGPWARDMWRFNSEVQFLANRGYAVLQMNFRGSTGYGKKFWEISFKEWGKTMQDDISDGVKWLISQGIADPKRVAIYGGSYGGYATLAGLAFTPELYACGVDYVGVSNLFTFMKTIPPYWKPYLDMFYEMVGDMQKDSVMLASSSPVFHVDKIKAPLLVAQGAKDPRVNINESNQIVDALKKKGIDVPYLVKENEGHGFRNEENRFDFYEAMEKFLAKHLLDQR
ncbi:MAG: S9 family peptidase [Ignavibacteriales bacterium]|nr:S9 family peptidase [Ignavibacteriales bacterium]